MAPVTNPPVRLVRLPEVLQRTGYKKSAIYAAMAEGRFPRQVKLGARAVAWAESDLSAWIEARILASRGEK